MPSQPFAIVNKISCFVSVAVIACLLALSAAPRAVACLWDHDTLRTHAAGMPGVLEILVGHYEVQPARYYELRLARVRALLDADPRPSHADALAMFDDAGVALDRLGRYDEAIAMMERKLAALRHIDADDPLYEEHEYRRRANLGTFYAHRWLVSRRASGDGSLDDLERACALIAAGIELNPDAHFGREFVQLRLLEVLLETQSWGDLSDESALPELVDRWYPYKPYTVLMHVLTEGAGMETDPFDLHRSGRGRLNETQEKLLEGYLGLIVLGQAAESVDVHAAVAVLLSKAGRGTLAFVALERVRELLDSGRRSLLLADLEASELLKVLEYELNSRGAPARDLQAETRRYFRAARGTADKGREERVAYMDARFDAGKHPDTHERFWAGYQMNDLPQPPNGFWGSGTSRELAMLGAAMYVPVFVGPALAFLIVMTFVVLKRRRRRRQLLAVAGSGIEEG